MKYSYVLTEQSKREIEEAFKSSPDETKQRLSTLNRDIDSATTVIKIYQSKLIPEKLLLPLVDIRGDLVQEREELLEELRIQGRVKKAKAQGWNRSISSEFIRECPVCFEELPKARFLFHLCAGCLLMVCNKCVDNIREKNNDEFKCPQCRRRQAPAYAEVEKLGELLKEHKKLMKSHAIKGKSVAQLEMGLLCHVDGDYESMVRWCTLAAEQGEPQALHRLGVSYYFGRGVAKSKSMAKEYFLSAAKKGFRESTEALATMLSDISPGDSTNAALEALLFADLAYWQGSFKALTILGWFHATGSGGLEKSAERSIYWKERWFASRTAYAEGLRREWFMPGAQHEEPDTCDAP